MWNQSPMLGQPKYMGTVLDAKQSIMKGVGQFAGGAATGLAAAAGAKNAAAAASGNPMQPGSGFGSGGVGKMFSGLFG